MADESFHRFIFREPQSIEGFCRIRISGFGALPKLTHVGSGEQRAVFLRLMFKNRSTFSSYFFRAQWNGHFDLIGSPLLPCSSVEPKFTIVEPRLVLKLVTAS